MADSTDSDIPTLDALARRYLDLWQEQWAALATDPEVADNLARLFQMLGQGAASLAPTVFGPGGFAYGSPPGAGWDPRQPQGWPFAKPAEPTEGTVHDRSASQSPAPAETGAASAGAAPVDRADGAAELARRLAALEERLASLEAGPD